MTKKDTIVDVGGGIGAVGLEIAKANPHVNLVIQDRDAVMEQAKEVRHLLSASQFYILDHCGSCGPKKCQRLSNPVASNLKVPII